MPDRRYDHNVDIKSTQLGNAIKNIGILIAGGVGGIIAAGFIGLVLLAIIVNITESNKEKEEKQARKNAINITPYQTLTRISYDYAKNNARYRLEWAGKYVTHSGGIKKMNNSTFSMYNAWNLGAEVICDWSYSDQMKNVARLNPGDNTSVSGTLSLRRNDYNKTWVYTISDCEIDP